MIPIGEEQSSRKVAGLGVLLTIGIFAASPLLGSLSLVAQSLTITRGGLSLADQRAAREFADVSAHTPPADAARSIPDMPSSCDLDYRPGLTSKVPRGAELDAWLFANASTAGSLDRLEHFFGKLLRGQRVTVYFLGDSVTRGSGAGNSCRACAPRARARSPDADGEQNPELADKATNFKAESEGALHPWLRGSTPSASCAGFDAEASRGGDSYAFCVRRECRGDQGTIESMANSSSSPSELTQVARWCFPRNSWRCLVVHWFEHAWPGQVHFVRSSKPLLFMASCFGRALRDIDLILHEQAVNGGGKMLCLQERILHAALSREHIALLMLLWLPKTYHPTSGATMLRAAQDGLAHLGAHYSVPTLRVERAFAAKCAPGEAWCYDKAHATSDSALGSVGTLHADLNHPNEGGHAFLAEHVLALFQATAERAKAQALERAAGREPQRASRALPAPLYPINQGLGASSEDDSGLCVDVAAMERAARRNDGWAVTVEMASTKVARLPALQAQSMGAVVEWSLDVRGSDWLILTYMQSYANFGAVEVACVSGCACRGHWSPEAPVALVNATDPSVRFSEPQWALLDLSAHSAQCVVRVTSVSHLKFKLMLLSLIRVRAPETGDAAPGKGAGLVELNAKERERRVEALKCFGIGSGFAVNGRVRTTAPWNALDGAATSG